MRVFHCRGLMNLNQKRLFLLISLLSLSALAYYTLWAQKSKIWALEDNPVSPASVSFFSQILSKVFYPKSAEVTDQVEKETSAGATPDVFHFFLFDTDLPLGFVAATCILSAHLNHGPEAIILHTNKNLTRSRYIDLIKAVVGPKFQVSFEACNVIAEIKVSGTLTVQSVFNTPQ